MIFVTTDLLQQRILGYLELTAINWEDMRNRPGAGTATMRIDSPTAIKDYLRPWASALWAIENKEIVFGGLIGAVQPKGNTRVLNIPIHGFMEYFRNFLIKGTQGMSNATLVNNLEVRWNQVEQFEIIRDLIRHAQSFPRTNAGIDVVWDTASGIRRDQTYAVNEAKQIGEAIEQIAERIDGFDWWQEYYFKDNITPAVRFRLASDRSRSAPYVLAFRADRQVTEPVPSQYAAVFSGTEGSYVSTPVSQQSGIELMGWRISADTNWSPDQRVTLVSQWDEVRDRLHYSIDILTNNRIQITWVDGADTYHTVTSDQLPFTEGLHGINVDLSVTETSAVDQYGPWSTAWETDWVGHQTYIQGVTFRYTDDITQGWNLLSEHVQEVQGLPTLERGHVEIGAQNSGATQRLEGHLKWAIGYVNNQSVPEYLFDARLGTEPPFRDTRGHMWYFNGGVALQGIAFVEVARRVAIPGNSNIIDYDLDGGNIPLSFVTVIGEGEGADMKWARVGLPSDMEPFDGPAYEDSYSQKDLKVASTITNRGQALLRQEGKIRQQIVATVDPNAHPQPYEVLVADHVRTVIHDGFVQVDGQYEIFRRKFNYDKNQQAQVTVELVEL